MPRAKSLPGAVNRRQCLLRSKAAVPGLRRREAGIAIAAGRACLAEILQQHLPPARYRFAIAEHRVKLVALDALVGFVRIRLLDHAA